MSNEQIPDAVKRQLEDHEKRISELEALLQTKPEPAVKKLSVKELILSKKPKSEVQKALVIGWYLEKHEGLASFNIEDLESGFRSAKEPVPKNINLAVIGNIAKGYMMEAKERKDNKKAWYLTNSGENCVEMGFEPKK